MSLFPTPKIRYLVEKIRQKITKLQTPPDFLPASEFRRAFKGSLKAQRATHLITGHHWTYKKPIRLFLKKQLNTTNQINSLKQLRNLVK